MDRRYLLSQVMKTVFQCLLYLSLFLSFFMLLSITNPQVINLSRTAATTMATFAILLLIFTLVYGGYQLGVKKARSVFSSLVIAITLTDIVSYLQLEIMNVNPAKNHRLILLGEDFGLFLAAMVLQIGAIYLFVSLGYHYYFRINPPEKCLIVTSSQEQAQHIAEKIATFRQKYKLSDVLHYQCPDVQRAILAHDVVFLAGIPDTEEAQLKSFCYEYGKTIYLQAELEDVVISTSQQSVIDDTLFLYIHRVEPTLFQRALKRASDIGLSLIGLALASPLLLISGVAIKLSSPGRVFFRQKRATIGGKVFEIVKFRTMYENACETQAQSACENDERITRLGRFMRKYRIDELPQLFNVLKGDMSIVGPRPEMLENVDRYTQEVPEFEYRKQMKAGLTGMAQIDGKYNTTPKDKVILDLMYIENFSLMLDVKLILRTVTIFFRRDSTEGFHAGRRAFCPEMRTQALDLEEANAELAPEATAEAATAELVHPADAVLAVDLSRENTPVETVLEVAQLAGGETPAAVAEQGDEPDAAVPGATAVQREAMAPTADAVSCAAPTAQDAVMASGAEHTQVNASAAGDAQAKPQPAHTQDAGCEADPASETPAIRITGSMLSGANAAL